MNDVLRALVKENGHLYREAYASAYPEVIPAPDWLVKRMEGLKNRQPPTIEEVKRQMAASAKK